MSQKDIISVLHHSGRLLKRVPLLNWRPRSVELFDFGIRVQLLGGLKYSTFALNHNCTVTDSSEKAFCFKLRNTSTNETLVLAALNQPDKEEWMNAIHGVLALSRKRYSAVNPSYIPDHDEGKYGVDTDSIPDNITLQANKFKDRHQIAIKIIKGINIMRAYDRIHSPDKVMEVLVKITVGSQCTKSIHRKTTAEEDPEWGQVFFYDWTVNTRFAKVEVIEYHGTNYSGNAILGVAMVPLYQYPPYISKSVNRYPLYSPSSSNRKAYSDGFIQLEIGLNGTQQPDEELLTWQFLKEVQKLPEIGTCLVSRETLDYNSAFTDRRQRRNSTNGRLSINDLDSRDAAHKLKSFVSERIHGSTDLKEDSKEGDNTLSPTSNGKRRPSQRRLSSGGSSEAAAESEQVVRSRRMSLRNMIKANAIEDVRRAYEDHLLAEVMEQDGELDEVDELGEHQSGKHDVDSSLSGKERVSVASERNSATSTGAYANKNDLRPSLVTTIRNMEEKDEDDEIVEQVRRSVIIEDVDVLMEDEENILEEEEEDVPKAEEDILGNDGFPFIFPSPELEYLEDFCMKVSMVSKLDKSEVSIRGVLLLTNYRVIFVTCTRIFNETTDIWKQYQPYDLTTFVPNACIQKVELYRETHTSPTGNAENRHVDVLMMRTTNSRTLWFHFHETDVRFPTLRLFSKRLVHRCCVDTLATNPETMKKASDMIMNMNCMTSLAKLLQKMYNEGTDNVDGMESDEGIPSQRIYLRLFYRVNNREIELDQSQKLHKNVMQMIRSSTAEMPDTLDEEVFNMSDEERYELLKPISDRKVDDPLTKELFDNLSEMQMVLYDSSIEAFERRLIATSMESRVCLRSILSLGWTFYNPQEEFRRMGIPDSKWRLTRLNNKYEFCATYPRCLAVPATVDDKQLIEAASFRSKERIPTLVWRSRTNKCSLSRSSQPLPGLTGGRNQADERLISEMNKCGPYDVPSDLLTDAMLEDENGEVRRSVGHIQTNKPFIVIDARPEINAMANQYVGKGYENDAVYDNISVQFMNMENIHVVRNSLHDMFEAVTKNSGWLANLKNSGWTKHVRRVLQGAVKIVQQIAIEQKSVLVHCSDGWDRTPQLTSLSMLMLDPFYRTIKGFAVLIEKEFISFGHQFAERCGWSKKGFQDEHERSPIMVQWLDCVYQCIHQHPNDFEFNEELLLFLAKHLYSGWFGNFLFNCEKDAMEHHNKYFSFSIWTHVFSCKEQFLNETYVPNKRLSVPTCLKQKIAVWHSYFGSWNDQLFAAAWLSNYSDLPEDMPDSKLNGKPMRRPSAKPDNVGSAWVDDSLINDCTRCNRMFTTFLRKHHCRKCGKIFCGKCSDKWTMLPEISSIFTQRVCVDCHADLQFTASGGSTKAKVDQANILTGDSDSENEK